MIDQDLINFFKNQLETKSFRSGISIEISYEELKKDHIKFYGKQEEKLKAIDYAFLELKRERAGIRSLSFASTISKKNQQEWYLSPDENIDLNWFAFKKYLSVAKSWSEDEINSVDASSTKVVNQILSPASEKEKRFQGLVLGYVQSGKTSNMAATIAKAADRGYKLIIILAGLTDSLRKQTQVRMQKDIGQHLEDRWFFCTDEENDFTSYTELPTWDNERKTTILIIKKNVFILRRLLKKIKNQSEVKRKGMTTLIIDDECDQASLNTKAYREQVSQTNKLIRQILENLRKVTYLGYTATPYANILTPQKSVDGKLDLYPNDFIISLDEPKNYFGARKLFGDEFDIDKDNELPFIRRVKAHEIENLQPPSQKARFNFTPSLTQSLVDSCDYYLLSLCAKALRGQGDDHCCMLIHTTIYSETHKDLKNLLINKWLNPLIKNIEIEDKFTLDRLKLLWDRESKVLDKNFRKKLSCPEDLESFDEMQKLLLKEAKSIQLVIENSTVNSKDRLDFDGGKNIHAIVIGGNVLARGLTIEGLICSFFIRSSTQYDTLMQMGRWFGYRKGYEDLPRIWMTFDLEYNFRDLVNVENLIRSDISDMGKEGLTPQEMSIRVPLLANLNVTARNKIYMNKVSVCVGSLYGTYKQTIAFPTDVEFHKSNYSCIEALINNSRKYTKNSFLNNDNCHVLKDVDYPPILKFFRSFKFNEETLEKIDQFIENEVDEEGSSLEKWNIGIIGSKTSNRKIKIGELDNISTVNRSKQFIDRTSLKNKISIKALMFASDLLVDVDREKYNQWKKQKDESIREWDLVRQYREEVLGKRPLLLIFPINRDSLPRNWDNVDLDKIDDAQKRVPIFYGLERDEKEKHEIFGIGVVFPSVDKFNTEKFLKLDLINIDEFGEIIDDKELVSEEI